MCWLQFVTVVACLTTTGTAISLQQCSGRGLLTLTPTQPYNVTCPHDDTTRKVTWRFTSLLDTPTHYVIAKDCVLFSRSSDEFCTSELPGFRVLRPHVGYTSLDVNWDLLTETMTFGMVTCVLDDVTFGTCFLRLLWREATTTSPSTTTPQRSAPTIDLPTTSQNTENVTRTTSNDTSTSDATTSTTTSVTTGLQDVSSSSSPSATTPLGTTTTTTMTTTASTGSFQTTSSNGHLTITTITSKTTNIAATTTTPQSTERTLSPSESTTTTTDIEMSSGSSDRVILIASVVGVVAAIPAVIVGVVVFCLWRKRYRRFQSTNNDEGSLHETSLGSQPDPSCSKGHNSPLPSSPPMESASTPNYSGKSPIEDSAY